MRYSLIYIGLTILLSACGQRSELIQNKWLVLDGNYMGQPIEFRSTDLLRFSDRNGNEISSLYFSKDETIVLPGINSSDISARWTIENDKIRFVVDSIRYSIYNTIDTDLSFLDSSDSVSEKPPSENEVKGAIVNPLTTKEFKTAMVIYGQSFDYHISLDTLVLKGQDGRIRAVRDRTIDDMFRGL